MKDSFQRSYVLRSVIYILETNCFFVQECTFSSTFIEPMYCNIASWYVATKTCSRLWKQTPGNQHVCTKHAVVRVTHACQEVMAPAVLWKTGTHKCLAAPTRIYIDYKDLQCCGSILKQGNNACHHSSLTATKSMSSRSFGVAKSTIVWSISRGSLHKGELPGRSLQSKATFSQFELQIYDWHSTGRNGQAPMQMTGMLRQTLDVHVCVASLKEQY